MKTVTTIETEIGNVTFAIWDKKLEALLPIPEEMEIEEAAKKVKCSPELIDALTMLTGNIIEAIKEDLETIWERLDELERKT